MIRALRLRDFTLAEIFGEKYGPEGILQWRGIRGGLPEAARQGTSGFGVVVRLEMEASRRYDRIHYLRPEDVGAHHETLPDRLHP